MGNKKSSSKSSLRHPKQYKGVDWIATRIRKRHPSRYENRASAKVVAKQILADLRSEGQRVTIKNIYGKIPQKILKGKAKREAPILDEGLTAITNYFNLSDYPLFVSRMAQVPEVLFEGLVIPNGLADMVGGFEYDYTEYFAPFVAFIDGLRGSGESTMYQEEWYVTCTEPSYNKNTKRWNSKIISCDVDGNEMRYGFDPNSPNKMPSAELKTILSTDIPKGVEKVQENAQISELDKQITLEKEKQRTLLFEMYSKDKIDKAFFDAQMKRLG